MQCFGQWTLTVGGLGCLGIATVADGCGAFVEWPYQHEPAMVGYELWGAGRVRARCVRLVMPSLR